MTFYLLNINEEPTASLLLGHLNTLDGTPLIALYELQEGSSKKFQLYIDELLKSISQVLDTPAASVVMMYQRSRYSGVWYKYKPALEIQDVQSLDFMGFDPDVVRDAAKDTGALTTIQVRLEGFAKDTSHTGVFETLEQLWTASSGEVDFKTRVAAWSGSTQHKATV